MKASILVIDDEESIREIISDFLGDEGFYVLGAETGSGGLAKMEERKPDVVLLDMMLPDQSGMDVLKKIKRQFPDVIVLMMTGMHEEGVAKEAILAGAYDYLTKPVSLERLKTDFLDRIFPPGG